MAHYKQMEHERYHLATVSARPFLPVVLLALLLTGGCRTRDTRPVETTPKRPVASDADRDSAAVAPRQPPATSGPSADDDERRALSVLQGYYDAINERDYRRAYTAWGPAGPSTGQTFEAFRQGFSRTARVTLAMGTTGPIEGAAGSRYIEVPVTIMAIQRDSTVQRFHGSYTLRRSVVTGASDAEQRWHLYRATLVHTDTD
jgi:hypothetical protein